MKFSKLFTFFLILIFTGNFIAQTDRNTIDNRYKWNLSDLYSSVDDWHAAKVNIESRVNDISKHQGKLGESASNLFYTMDTYYKLIKDYYKLSVYSNRLKDEDLNISENESLAQLSSNLGTKISETSSFIDPEILKIAPEKIKLFYSESPELLEYKTVIDDIQRLRAHTLSESEEKILASFGLVTGTPGNVYSIFDNAEMPRPTVKLADGKEVELNSSNYVKYRGSENRDNRALVFDAFFNNIGKFKNTIGANLAGKVKSDFIYGKNRNYATALEYSLDRFNIPTDVYKNLITEIHNSLPTLHRFLALKQKMLGLDQLHYYDLYTSIVDKVELNYTVEEGQAIILESLKPLGSDYISTVKKSFDDQWIDYYPNKGKRSGAYSSGSAYDVHPYILMNWTDDYNSVSTLAHELGHTMHSYYSNKNQNFANSNYSTFVAEIASTCNEDLLNNFMVQKVKSDKEKIFLLGSYLELLRTTIFRQVLFAEFELIIHEKIENSEPLNGEIMSSLYYDLVKKYYGHDEGVCIIDPYVAYEWAYIPHFIGYSYYVYQYSTSLIYATAFAQKIINEGQPAVDAYFNILKGGSSDYPIDLIKKAGLDPLSSEPFELVMAKMNSVMDQIEEIIK
ncbi:MAG: oligoendopeptidase F [Bacteroidetes bacterium]|nr:oligoendopeptidase F [Bacteroidota bacterium]